MSANLTGLFVHLLDDDYGSPITQGEIIGDGGAEIRVQVFDGLLGTPHERRTLDRAYVLGPRCRIYRDVEAWRSAFARRGFR